MRAALTSEPPRSAARILRTGFSNSLATPLRHPSAIDWDMAVGEDVLFAVFQSVEDALRGGFRRSLRDIEAAVMSVSTGPRKTPWTVTPSLASSALRDCVMLNAAAFEIE